MTINVKKAAPIGSYLSVNMVVVHMQHAGIYDLLFVVGLACLLLVFPHIRHASIYGSFLFLIHGEDMKQVRRTGRVLWLLIALVPLIFYFSLLLGPKVH